MTPKVSILLANYNGGDTLKRCINSVLNQTFSEFEFIIRDDGSVDNSREIIASYHDKRIFLKKNTKNLGQTKTLNLLLKDASAEYIARIDSDDTWENEKLAKQYAVATSRPDLGIIGSYAYKTTLEGKRSGKCEYPESTQDIKATALFASPVCHISVLMKKSCVTEAGGYPEKYKTAADYALWSNLLKNNVSFLTIKEYLCSFTEAEATYGASHFLTSGVYENAEIMRCNFLAFAKKAISIEDSYHVASYLPPCKQGNFSTICNTHWIIQEAVLSTAKKGLFKWRLRCFAMFVNVLTKKAFNHNLSFFNKKSLPQMIVSPVTLLALLSAMMLSYLPKRKLAIIKDYFKAISYKF